MKNHNIPTTFKSIKQRRLFAKVLFLLCFFSELAGGSSGRIRFISRVWGRRKLNPNPLLLIFVFCKLNGRAREVETLERFHRCFVLLENG